MGQAKKRVAVDVLGHKVRDEVAKRRAAVDAFGDKVRDEVAKKRAAVDELGLKVRGEVAKKRAVVDEIGHKVRDEVRFLKNWIDKPLVTGAVAPSSPQLAELMASYVDPSKPGLVIELGPGTGVVTKALLDRGVAAERIVSIEYNGDFCTLLRQRYPGVHFVHGDAYRLAHTLAEVLEGAGDPPIAAVVSSLPLFTRPLTERTRLLDDSFTRMAPGSPFIQFSYALVSPVPHGATRFEIERSGWVVRNLPPARVWVYRRFD